ncbi:MAG: hypothetical protein EPN53_02035, partial [Acidobacteria bacterium]
MIRGDAAPGRTRRPADHGRGCSPAPVDSGRSGGGTWNAATSGAQAAVRRDRPPAVGDGGLRAAARGGAVRPGGAMPERLLEHDLEELKKLLLTMAGEVERQLGLAIRALVERDSELAEAVIAGDAVIDQREVEVDHRVIELIVRTRPMARDLRLAMTAIKIAPDLERVADHAVSIARQALLLNQVPPLKAFITIPRMAEAATAMVRDAISAFVQG